jgi:hypothetical protein
MMKMMETTSPIERVDLRISTMESRISALKEIKPVLATLYYALSDDQEQSRSVADWDGFDDVE